MAKLAICRERRATRKWVACDAGGETAGHGLLDEGGGAGDEKLEKKRKKEAKHKQRGFEGKGNGEAVEKRKRPSEKGNEAQKPQHGEGEGSSRASEFIGKEAGKAEPSSHSGAKKRKSGVLHLHTLNLHLNKS